jgi:TonB family protein
MMDTEKKNNFKGLAGTVIFHGLLLVFFMFFGFRTPLPLPAEQGIAINFGTSDEGMGDVQPDDSGDNQGNTDEAASKQVSSTAPSSSQQSAATQDIEDAPSVSENKSPKTTPNNTNPVTKPSEPIQEETKPKLDPRADYSKIGAGSRGSSQGQTGQPGDQGSRDGSRNTDRQGEGGRGGLIGSPDFDLVGRQITQKPNISDKSQKEGKVVVLIWVDKSGRVLRAQAGHRGTTLQDAALWEKCQNAALNARFSSNEEAPDEQRGTITFLFKLE